MRKSMPWNISVRHQDERSGDQSWKTVIPAIPTVTETTFRQFSVHGASSVSGKDSPVRGVISAELPPPEGIPGAAGASGQLRYTFAGIVPDPRARPDGITAAENAKVEWTVEIPAPQRTTGGPQASYWAVLTETGSLWVAPGYPWYEPATWAGMLDRRGSVFSTAMEMHEAELRTEWDPFTGEH